MALGWRVCRGMRGMLVFDLGGRWIGMAGIYMDGN